MQLASVQYCVHAMVGSLLQLVTVHNHVYSAKKRNYLTLEKKVEVIKTLEKNPGMKMRSLAKMFDCGKTQVAKVIKGKDSVLSMYEAGMSKTTIHDGKTSRTSEYAEVNKAVYDWYTLACSKNIFPGGSQIAEKGRQIASALGKPGFKGSNGWLDKWKKRYDIRRFSVCGESGEVQGQTVDSWKELPEILQGYEKEDIMNLYETGFFWQALPDRGFGQQGKECKGGKKSKKRLTAAFIVSAAGKKEKPVVICKSENPQCFERFDKSLLPVDYFSHKKAWMTGEIMESVLTKLNHSYAATDRKVLLLMDNAKCHPEYLKTKFSNIKIVFLPANMLQRGIVQNFKVHYRRLFLKHVLARIDQCGAASDVVKSINILAAVRWVAFAWEMVKPETISKCFRKAGVLQDNTVNVMCAQDSDDPFLEMDACLELQNLIKKTVPPEQSCSLVEYLCGEDEIPVCMDIDGDDWDANFLAQLGGDDDDEDDDIMDQEPVPKVKSFSEAIKGLDDIQLFLECRGCISEASLISSAVDMVSSAHIATMKQTTL